MGVGYVDYLLTAQMRVKGSLWSYAYQKEFGTIVSGSTTPQNQGRSESLWHAMKNHPHDPLRLNQWMGSYSSEYAKNIYALQAADLFAYEITHEFGESSA